jgi:hypothetical protein
MVLSLMTTDRSTFLLLLFFTELVVFAGVAPINTVLVRSVPPALVTIAQGLTISAINVFGSLTSPVVLGVVADRSSLALAMQLCSVALVLNGIFWLIGSYFGGADQEGAVAG